ncbi:hypothetical protein GCM10028806_28250 [Spirosoma terrae]|uniref:Uncharacterized protein n=1 Tax=Spirosoma terrae TaxID=1968276 RepID=A0A6L9LED9_9BACT|nr:hypothetical protein [Spirosoma terrae]NDU97213.1 hypothetical protein [Spirosoma terrae]
MSREIFKTTTKFNGKGFTPQGQKHLPPTDVSGLIPCQAYGGDLINNTTFYIPAHRLVATLEKHAALGRTLRIPQAYTVDGQPVDVPKPVKVEVTVTKSRKRKEYIICLNDGKMFESREEAAHKYYMDKSHITEHLQGRAKFARGRSFRLATAEEIEAYKIDAWEYTGECLPIDTSFRR